jgi:elongation factor 1-alpha
VIILFSPCRITKGQRCILLCHAAEVSCEFAELLEKTERKSGTTIEKYPEFLKTNDTALVKIIPLKPICVEKYSDYPSLSSFVIFDREWVMAVGTIKHVEKKDFSSMSVTTEKN